MDKQSKEGVISSNLERYEEDLDRLVKLGSEMESDLQYRHFLEAGELDKEGKKRAKKLKGTFESQYQLFYTEALAVIKQLIPARLREFETLYEGEPRRKYVDSLNYTIQDWLNGVRAEKNQFTGEKPFNDFAGVVMRFGTQFQILKSVRTRFDSSLHDIKQLVQADLFDSEIAAASELVRKGFLRGGGAIAGVVLEKHLGQVMLNHSLTTRKKAPGISDYNELLKKEAVIDVPVWRQIQRLGDIRNLCDHNKDREPNKDELEELVSGVEKITKTIF